MNYLGWEKDPIFPLDNGLTPKRVQGNEGCW